MHNDPFALQDHRKRYRIRTRGRSLSNLMRMLSKTNHNLISCLSHFFCHGWILVKPTFCFFLKQIKNKIDNLSFQRSISGDEEGQPAGQVQEAEIVYVKERLAWRPPSSSISVRAGFSLVWIRNGLCEGKTSLKVALLLNLSEGRVQSGLDQDLRVRLTQYRLADQLLKIRGKN